MDTMRVEIHFHQQGEASGVMECTAIQHEQTVMELLFFASFTATQIDDLRANDMQAASSLAQTLASMQLPIAPLDADLEPFAAFISGTAPNTPRLVDYKGSSGIKMFGGELRAGPPPDFRLLRKGFGLLGRGRVPYVQHSVLHLLKYLARRRQHDAEYFDWLWCLAQVAAGCGRAFLNGKMTRDNYFTEAWRIVGVWLDSHETLGPCWVKDAPRVWGTTDRTAYLALIGHSAAQYQMGMMYYQGEGQPQDYEVAADYFQKAAEQGNEEAKKMLSEIRSKPAAKPKMPDGRPLVTWSDEYVEAMEYYHGGKERPQDYKAAADLCEKAAKDGFWPAKHMLGNMYLHGHGVEQSATKGLKWLTEAALEGYIPAQVELGEVYYTGLGVSQNLKEATKWYEMAAKKNDPTAKKRLLEIGSSGK